MDPILIALGGLIFSIVSFIIGQFVERRKQSLQVRSELLKPIEEWIGTVEKMVSVLADTLVSRENQLDAPMMYDMGERKNISKYLAEKSNHVHGILASKTLQVYGTKKLARDLNTQINAIENLVINYLLPLEVELSGRTRGGFTFEDITRVISLKRELDFRLRNSRELVASIRVKLI